MSHRCESCFLRAHGMVAKGIATKNSEASLAITPPTNRQFWDTIHLANQQSYRVSRHAVPKC